MDEAKAHDATERARTKADEEGQALATHCREGAKPIPREREAELEGQIRALLATLPAYGTPMARLWHALGEIFDAGPRNADRQVAAAALPAGGLGAYAKLMNTREIDGGPINGCENDYQSWRARIFQPVQETKLSDAFNPETRRRVAKAVFGGPEYLAVQTCRDKMEFALRPR